jgi:hypothetical protein
MANPNIVNVTSILGKTAVLNATTTPTDIVTNSSASNTIVKINALIVSNIEGATATDVNASVFRGGTEFKVAHTISIPGDASLVVLDKGTSIYLEEGDSLRITAGANSRLQAVCSYEVIS